LALARESSIGLVAKTVAAKLRQIPLLGTELDVSAAMFRRLPSIVFLKIGSLRNS
jgi:hypothetical protein